MNIIGMNKRGSLLYRTAMTPQQFCVWLNELEASNNTAFTVRDSGGAEIMYHHQVLTFHLFGKVSALKSKFRVIKEDGGIRMVVIFRKPLIAFPAILTAWLVFVFGLTYGLAVTSEAGVTPELIVLGAAAFIIAALLWVLVMFQARFSIRELRRHILQRERMGY